MLPRFHDSQLLLEQNQVLPSELVRMQGPWVCPLYWTKGGSMYAIAHYRKLE